MRTVFFDIEIVRNFAIIGFLENSRFDYVIIHDRLDAEEVATIRDFVGDARLVGYNNLHYDTFILGSFLNRAKVGEVHELSQAIIAAPKGEPAWMVAERFRAPKAPFDQLDLRHYVTGKVSLKKLEARLGMARVVDLPFDPHSDVAAEQVPEILDYLRHDLEATATLHAALAEEIATRETMAAIYNNASLLQKPPAAAAESAILSEYMLRTGTDLEEIRSRARKFWNSAVVVRIPKWVRRVAEGTRADDIIAAIDGIEFPYRDGIRGNPSRPLPDNIDLDGLVVSFGVGGLHSQDGVGSAYSDNEGVLIDCDAASYYPFLILRPGGAPLHLDAAIFRDIYAGLVRRRLEAKAAGHKREANALKLILNSTFGKQGEMYSALFSPASFLAITLGGQLGLIALIDRVQKGSNTIVLSANTDGILMKVPIGEEHKVAKILGEWESLTGFQLEQNRLAAYRRRDVNCYLAIDSEGTVKAKGAFGIAGDLGTDHKELIVARAVAAAMKGEDPATVVRMAAERHELGAFIRTLATTGGGFVCGGETFGRVIRVIRTTRKDAPDIIDQAKGKVGDKHMAKGCRIVRNLDERAWDLDVGAYVDAASEIVAETDVVIDRRRTLLARSLEAVGLKTVGLGGAGASTGGDFSGTAEIAVLIGDRHDFVVVAPDVLGEATLVAAVDGRERFEIHRKSLLPPETAKALRKAELAMRRAAGAGSAARRLVVHGDGVEFRLAGDGSGETMEIEMSETRNSERPLDNFDFLEGMFGGCAGEAFVTAFAGDPKTQRDWSGAPARLKANALRRRDLNSYVAISTVLADADGGYHRVGAAWDRLFAVVVDDIGAKVEDPRKRGWGEPTAIVETSPGNYQFWYRLSEPEGDRFRATTLIAGLYRDRDDPIGDPGMRQLAHFARLPGGINGKKDYAVDGKPAAVRLDAWNPEIDYSAGEIAGWMGIVLPAIGEVGEWIEEEAGLASLEDALAHPAVVALQASGLKVSGRLNPRGWLAVTCPWVEEHTGGKAGSAVRIDADGSWRFCCHHGHCLDRKGKAVWEWLGEQGHEVPPPFHGRAGLSFETVETERFEFDAEAGDNVVRLKQPKGVGSGMAGGENKPPDGGGDSGKERGKEAPKKEQPWPEPGNLFSEVALPEFPWAAFEGDALGFHEKAEPIARNLGVGVDVVAMVMIAVACAAVHDKSRFVWREGWLDAVTFWLVLVGDVSTRKSPVLDRLMAPILEAEAEKGRLYASIFAEWKRLPKVQRDEREEPVPFHYVASTGTIEGLAKTLARQDRGLIIHSDELTSILSDMGRYSKASDRPMYLSAWMARPRNIIRVKYEVSCEVWALSMLGSIQPDIAENLRSSRDGFEERFISINLAPARRSESVDCKSVDSWFTTQIKATLKVKPINFILPRESEGIIEDLERQAFIMTRALKGDAAAIAGWCGKLTSHVARVAVGIHQLKGGGELVSMATLKQAAAIVIGYCFAHQSYALKEGPAMLACDEKTATLARYILRLPKGTVSLVPGEVSTRLKPFRADRDNNQLRTAQQRLMPSASLLADKGWLRPHGPEIGGAVKRWLINPGVWDRFAEVAEREVAEAARIHAMYRTGGAK